MTTLIRKPAEPFRADVLRGEVSQFAGEVVDIGLADFPCHDCGAFPSVGWCVREDIEDGIETLTGYSVCEAHVPAGFE